MRRKESEKGRFTLVFLAAPADESRSTELQAPELELTYNWDPETYTGGRNFGHLAYRVDDIYALCQHLQDNGVTINRPPRDGHMAFVRSLMASPSSCCRPVNPRSRGNPGVHGEYRHLVRYRLRAALPRMWHRPAGVACRAVSVGTDGHASAAEEDQGQGTEQEHALQLQRPAAAVAELEEFAHVHQDDGDQHVAGHQQSRQPSLPAEDGHRRGQHLADQHAIRQP